jgi:outer membrane assembly lipoprotein YfiO
MNRLISLCTRVLTNIPLIIVSRISVSLLNVTLISVILLGLPLTAFGKIKSETAITTTKTKTPAYAIKKNKPSKKKKKNKTITEMSFLELQEAKDKRLAKKDTEGAIRYLEKMMTTCSDKDDIAAVLIELADLFFDSGKLVQAEKLYSQFYALYPGNDNVEKAHYKAILCCFYLTLDNDRDQSKTQETLTLTNSFLDRKEIFKTYTQDVSSIQQKCYEKLCQSSLNIAEFYLKRGKSKDLIAANLRLDSVRNEYLDKVPSLEPRVLALEIDYAVKTKDFVGAEQKRTLLAHRFPGGKATLLATDDTKKSSFIDRF